LLVSRCSLDEQGTAGDGSVLPDVVTDGPNDVSEEKIDATEEDAGVQDAPPDVISPSDLTALVVWLRSDRGLNIANGKIATWADQTTNGNDATQSNAANQPVYNAATASLNNQPTLSFTAASSTYLRIADNTSLQPATITVAILARYSAPNAYEAMITRTTSGNWNDGWGMSNGPVANYGQLEFWVNNYATGDSLAVKPLGTWHFWLGIYDGASVTLYVDDAKQTSTPTSGNITYPATTDTLIGAYWGVASTTPIGFGNIDVAEVMIYGRALTQAEASDLHDYVKARYATP
jgi:hypothetical protein